MSIVHKTKEKTKPNTVIDLLNQSLANAICLQLAAKQAHWNVKGDNFMSLHALFDKLSGEVSGYVDLLAERVVQLGATAQGTLETVSCQSVLPPYPVDIHGGSEHVRALCGAVSVLADTQRQAIDAAAEAGDAVTADLFTEITRGLDKLHWFLRSHQV